MEDVVVVGAGQAGLAASWQLARRGVGHVVLERGRVAETWRTQRWDSFALNTPTWVNRLPGVEADPGPADGFLSGAAWAAHLDDYARRFGLPVRTGAEVVDLERRSDGTFAVRLGGDSEVVPVRCVIVASGIQREPRIPAGAASLPGDVLQLHTSAYRNPANLPDGAVLVVGAAQSGGQVVDDLLDAGRTVHWSTSRVPRARRRTRGHDTVDLLLAAGWFDQTVASLPDPALQYVPPPLISGVGRHGHTLSLQWLEGRGAKLLGRLTAIERGRPVFADDLGANIRFGDETSAMIARQMADALAARSPGGEPPPLEDDPADEPHPDPDAVHAPTSLDLADEGISTVIWATGFRARFDWLPPDLLDERGVPRGDGGAMLQPGLYALGFPWLRTRGSGVIYGVGRDAAAVVDRITEHLAG